MNNAKRLARLKTLLERLNTDQDVSNRDLKLVLTEKQYQEMQELWKNQKEMKESYKDKPPEVLDYESRLKKVILAYARYEKCNSKKIKKSLYECKKFEEKAEQLAEELNCYFNEIILSRNINMMWFDRSIADGVDLSSLPRLITSRSHYLEQKPNRVLTIRECKINAVEEAISDFEDPKQSEEEKLQQIAEALKKTTTKKSDFSGFKM